MGIGSAIGLCGGGRRQGGCALRPYRNKIVEKANLLDKAVIAYDMSTVRSSPKEHSWLSWVQAGRGAKADNQSSEDAEALGSDKSLGHITACETIDTIDTIDTIGTIDTMNTMNTMNTVARRDRIMRAAYTTGRGTHDGFMYMAESKDRNTRS